MFETLNQTFLSVLNFYSSIFGGNYGFAIIAITLSIRVVLLPIIIPSVKSQKKMLDLKPELDKLKTKYGSDKQTLSKKQLELYKKHNLNPAAGCLPQLVQLGLFIAFYQVLITSLNGQTLDPNQLSFFWLQLNQPDSTLILPILAAATQLVLSLMILPGADTAAEKKLASQSKSKKDDKEALDMSEMANTMRSQMTFIMPLFTGFIATRFPSGLALYWVASTVFSVLQQYYVSGLGGLKPYLSKIGISS